MKSYEKELRLFKYALKNILFFMPYVGDNCSETISSCYFHYKSTVLKLGSMEAFGGGEV